MLSKLATVNVNGGESAVGKGVRDGDRSGKYSQDDFIFLVLFCPREYIRLIRKINVNKTDYRLVL